MAPCVPSTVDCLALLLYHFWVLQGGRLLKGRTLFWVLLCLLLVGGCSSKDKDEEAIKAVVDRLVTAVEMGDKNAFKDKLHLDYRDRFGHDRHTITDRIFLIVSEMNQLDIEVVGLEIEELDRDYGFARLFFKVKLHGEGRPRGYAWEEIKRRNIVLHLRRTGTEWQGIKGDLGIDLMGAIF